MDLALGAGPVVLGDILTDLRKNPGSLARADFAGVRNRAGCWVKTQTRPWHRAFCRLFGAQENGYVSGPRSIQQFLLRAVPASQHAVVQARLQRAKQELGALPDLGGKARSAYFCPCVLQCSS